jgi:glucose dehydrogenase
MIGIDRIQAWSLRMPEGILRIVTLVGAAVLALAPTPMRQSPSPRGLPVTYERLLKATEEPGNWLTYGGDYRSHHYSSLNQITTDNVHRLRAKWIYIKCIAQRSRSLRLLWMA